MTKWCAAEICAGIIYFENLKTGKCDVMTLFVMHTLVLLALCTVASRYLHYVKHIGICVLLLVLVCGLEVAV